MILLILVVLLWVAVLAPSAWRRYSERQRVGSIDHFHHELQLLEHAGPKTVAPAYRLHTTGLASGADGTVVQPSGRDSSRPKLVLLRPTDDVAAADVDDGAGGHYERVGVLDRPEPECVLEVGTDLRAFRRGQAHRRCTMLLRCLAGVAISTGVIGVFPGMHLAWIVTGLSGLAALALVGLMAYAKEIQAEQRRRQIRRAERAALRGAAGAAGSHREEGDVVEQEEALTWVYGTASDGGWGGYDEDEDGLPQAAAR